MASGQQLTRRVSEGRHEGVGGGGSWKGPGMAARSEGRKHEQACFVFLGPVGLPSSEAGLCAHIPAHAYMKGYGQPCYQP